MEERFLPFLWNTIHHFVKQYQFFLHQMDEEMALLIRSEGLVTTFLWLIPMTRPTMNEDWIRKELQNSITWMSAYHRRTPSLLFRSYHFFIYSDERETHFLEKLASLSDSSFTGRYASYSWVIHLGEKKVYTSPHLLSEVRGWAKSLQQLLLSPTPQAQEINERINEINRMQLTRRQQYRKRAFFRTGAPVTFTLTGINLLVWILLMIYGDPYDPKTLIQFGAKENALIAAGEYWRLVTPIFLHIGGLHLWFNSTALLSLGGKAERMYGSIRYLLIYLLSGVFGNLASFLFSPSISAGASGALFGIFGALLYFAQKEPLTFGMMIGPGWITTLLGNLLLGFFIPGIDNFAHIGGLIGGYLTAFFLRLPAMKEG